LTVSLYTSDVETALLESSTLFVEQAKKAGVKVVLDQVPGDQYYTNKYLKAAFAGSAWTARPLITQISQTLLSTAPYNETHWKNATFDKLVATARRTLDPGRRKELFVEAQRLLWGQGGYIIWGFRDYVDAYASKVNGLQRSVARPLGAYNFIHVHLT
jgi:peptide/nickel transport system substrate-binding protein